MTSTSQSGLILFQQKSKANNMPVHKNPDGTWQWGQSGKKYPTKQQAVKQAQAIYAAGWKEKNKKKY